MVRALDHFLGVCRKRRRRALHPEILPSPEAIIKTTSTLAKAIRRCCPRPINTQQPRHCLASIDEQLRPERCQQLAAVVIEFRSIVLSFSLAAARVSSPHRSNSRRVHPPPHQSRHETNDMHRWNSGRLPVAPGRVGW